MRTFFSILFLIGALLALVGLVSAINTAFDLDLAMRVSGSTTTLPNDWIAVIALLILGALFCLIGYLFSNTKTLAFMKKRKGLVILASLFLISLIAYASLLAVRSTDARDAIVSAAANNDIATVQAYLEEEQRSKGMLARLAFQAVYRGNPEMTALVFKHGAEPDVRQKHYYKGNLIHHTLWGEESPEKMRETIEVLIANGVGPNFANVEGEVPLAWAVEKFEPGNVAIVELLLESGADPNIQDQEGDTPLHRAVRYYDAGEEEKLPMVRLLLSYGADSSIENEFGTSPLDTAEWEEYPRIIELLRGEGP